MSAPTAAEFVGSDGWSKAYSDYLVRSTGQTARSMKLYQEVLEGLSQGRLPATVFQDSYLRFAQTHGPKYATRLADLSSRFLGQLVHINGLYSQEKGMADGEADIILPV